MPRSGPAETGEQCFSLVLHQRTGEREQEERMAGADSAFVSTDTKGGECERGVMAPANTDSRRRKRVDGGKGLAVSGPTC